MKERPILFSGAMVRAILDGRKTQTRRIVKPQPTPGQGMVNAAYCGHPHLWLRNGPCRIDDPTYQWECPYGKPGDLLWVRETTKARPLPNLLTGEPTEALCGEYSADGDPVLNPDGFDLAWWYSRPTCPAIHMPRAACRIELEVTGVRTERLNDCSVRDAIAEGADPEPPDPLISQVCPEDYLSGYRTLWDQINGAGAWKANPWVWVVEFRRV